MRFLAALAICSTISCCATTTALADQFNTKRCINMGNALDAPEEGAWGHTIEASSFVRIAEAGFDTVRIPVRWSAYTSDAPEYRIDEAFFARVTDVIEQALSNDLQVILNIHHFEGLNADPEAHYDQFIALWSQIAARYRDLPENVYFEVINEPNAQFKGDLMRRYIRAAFDKIRETNPTRILIIGGEEWSSIRSIPSIPKIDDPNQVYTFHYYDPFLFTHQKASWTPLKDSDVVRWGSEKDRRELAQAAEYARATQESLGIPLFLGEVGAYEKAPYEDVVAYTQATREAFESAGLAWCVWNFTATFPFFDSDTQTWDQRKLEALGLEAPAASSPAKPTASRTLEDAFNALRRHVGHDGELMMLPFADQLLHYGPITVKRRSDANVPGGVALEVDVARAAENPWDAGISGPFTVAAKAGDTLVMAYWARAVDSKRAVIANSGLQVSSAPYTPLSPLQPALLTDQWQRFVVTAVVGKDYAPSEIGYTLQVAGEQQRIRVGPMFVMNLGQGVSL
ncbi:MAG: glycoside hydrolase family 5 protein [Pseudomonadota bacterium]